MTSEERERMNSLSTQIQAEKDYRTFQALVRDLNDLILRKVSRFPQYDGANPWQRTRPWKTVSGRVQKIVNRVYQNHTEDVEITIPEAEHLFREIRIENTFTDVDGQQVALKQGAHLDVTFEADSTDTAKKISASEGHA
jgi:hypothetical protein